MDNNISKIFEQAIRFHREGKLKEAEHLYRSILKEQPEHLDVNNNLGVILQHHGKLEEAKEYYKKAIELKPDFAEAHNNLGNILHKQEKLDEAEVSYKKAIELKPDYAEAYGNLGNTLYKNRKLQEAETNYKKAIELKPNHYKVHNNFGNIQFEFGKFEEAKTSYKKAIELKPDYAEAHNNFGNIQFEFGKIEEAKTSYKKAIELKPDFAEAHNNLGNILHKQEKLDEAEVSYKKAIELKPDYAEAYGNLGNTLYKNRKLQEAETNYKKAIELKNDNDEIYTNLGITLNDKGDLVAAIDSFKQALNINYDSVSAWENIFFPLQAIKLQSLSAENPLPLLDEMVSTKYAKLAKSILSYRLNLGGLTTDSYLNETLSIISSTDNNFIKNPKVSSSALIPAITPLKKITAMIHFGRSGTGLLHSLIDGHPEVSTLPSIYFSEFFDHLTWKKFISGGWEEMADRFSTTYEVLFDASSAIKIASVGTQFIHNIGQKEGMTSVGVERNEVLSVDKKKFIKELKQLMNSHDLLDAITFFKLVHLAYDKTLHDHNEKSLIFYHIHNPDMYAKLNFLRLAPNTNWLMMVREPLQSCESWVRKNLHDNNYKGIAYKIFQMLFEIDQAIFQKDNSIGVKLEDLQEHPKKTIQALCGWLGIKEKESLYQMTAQGKKWWGDPTSPDFTKDGMNPFGKTSINRKLGSVFSKNDQFILHTLFYPFSVSFGYTEENLKQFKNNLQTIRPMLDHMFDFERKIAQHTKMSTEKFMKSGSYLYLRSGMIERWNTLNKFNTYPNMLTPLKIN